MDFKPLVIGALYPGITKGLSADILATQALTGQAFPVCTAHVVAGDGIVTDVLTVPTDTVSAQLEHLSTTRSPTATKIGVVGNSATATTIFHQLDSFQGPTILDLTISGPSGEDVLGQAGLDTLTSYLDQPDLVSLDLTDATLVAGMEIPSLDDAQVAVQRIAQQGAQRILLRCGRLPTHFFDTESEPPEYAVDLFYDGEDFALFEAPYLSGLQSFHGASSGLLLSLLYALQAGDSLESALQKSKGRVTEALRAAQEADAAKQGPIFFQSLQAAPSTRSKDI